MSVENLKTYLKTHVETHGALETQSMTQEDWERHMALAKEQGLPWDTSDVEALSKELQQEGELSEDELEMVSGGLFGALAFCLAKLMARPAGRAIGAAIDNS